MASRKNQPLTEEQWALVAEVEYKLKSWSKKWTPASLKKNPHSVRETYDVLLHFAAKSTLSFDKSKGFKFTTYFGSRAAYCRVCSYWRRMKPTESLDEPLASDGTMPRSDDIAAPDYDSEDDRLIDFHSALRYLSDRERLIVEHWYGLNGKKKMTRDELGAASGLSGARIWQIHRNAIEKLRKHITK
jgi:DNA-directed RNA polymerase sigma subunit (sigma70/sigma32)